MTFVDRAGSFAHDLAIIGGGSLGCTTLVAACLLGTYLALNYGRTGQITLEEPTKTPLPTATSTPTPLPTHTPMPTVTPLPSLDCQNIGPNGTAWRTYQTLIQRGVVPEPFKVLYVDLAWSVIGLPPNFQGVEVDRNNLPSKVGPEDYICIQSIKRSGRIFSNPRSLHPLQRRTLERMGYQVRPPKKL